MADFKLNYTGAQINTLLGKVNDISSLINSTELTASKLMNEASIGPILKLPNNENTLSLYTFSGAAPNVLMGKLGLSNGYANINLTDYTLHCMGNALFTNQVEFSNRIYYPHNNTLPCLENLAYYDNDASAVTGAIKITLPTTNAQCVMQIMEIWLYNYGGNSGNQIIISGYTYTDNRWYNYNSKVQGSLTAGIRLGYDGTHHCVLIGTTSTVWAYPKVWFKTWMGGHSNKMNWVNGTPPTISIITSESGYTITGTAS